MRLLAALGVVLSPGLAVLEADPAACLTVTVTFEGTVSEIDAPLASAFATGGIATGSFQIDAATPDTDPHPGYGRYPGLVNISFSVDGYAASAAGGDAASALQIANDFVDFYDVYTEGPFAGATDVGAFRLSSFQLQLFDEQNSALDSDALPTSLDASAFEDRRVVLNFFDGQSNALVVATLASLTLTVPEPTGAALGAAGAAVLLLAARAARSV